jgi:drug/metabolite transporter (DMT)-like permease
VALVALAAAFCYAASNVIEQRKASEAPPDTSMRIALLWHLARQPIWWIGIAVDLGGFGFQMVALGLGSLIFVQPLLVTSLLFSLVLGALAGSHRLSISDVAWAIVFMSSLSIFLVASSPSGGVDQRALAAWALPLAAITVVVTSCVLLGGRAPPAARSALFALAAGVTFGVSSTLMKSVSHEFANQGAAAVVRNWEPLALGAILALGFLILQSAFQADDLRAALPSVELAEPLVAGLLGLSLMHERLHASTPAAKAVIAGAVVLMVTSAAQLALSSARRHPRAVSGATSDSP